MSDAFTQLSSVDYDTAAYELLLRFPYRAELYFDKFTDVKVTNQTHRGSSVRFFTQADLAVASTPLTETVDPDAVALSDTYVDVTPTEYGNAVNITAKLEATSMFDIEAAAINALGYNAGVTIDTIARNVWQTGTNITYAQGDASSAPAGRTSVNYGASGSRNILRAVDFRKAYAQLQGANVPTFDGYYMAYLHPDVAFDIKNETGDLGWRAPQNYGAGDGLMGVINGHIGDFEGFHVVVSSRAPVFVNASNGAGATGTVDVYRTIFCGREAVAKVTANAGGYGPEPVVVKGLRVDKLQRFQPLGWKHFVGYGLFRAEAMRSVESSSSIANNAS